MNKIETISLITGIGLSAISAVASAYAAYQTAQQAVYAREALSASDLNRTFEDFYASWTTLCKALDPTPGRLIFGAQAYPDHRTLVVTATDLGYSFAAFDYQKYHADVVKAISEVGERYDRLSLWLPPEQLAAMNFEGTASNLTLMSMVDASDDEAVRYDSIFRQIGYCSFWRPQIVQWFQHRNWKIPVIPHEAVKLDFKADQAQPLTSAYIKKIREAK
ncbi:hypothetical protein [Neorhizobium galegae]|uniref:hypothetical protein n=1 Tax=Neorhizobium galegae TaxID=399 RepID=UPI000620F687|nr:hypothetical protein [Neorhizobium galegae]KAB1120003.1 hypothetical protein F4V90_31065 [Neorhizobium galegae]MCQ1810656.1 hypothetical protein [Neorhizobium galegae]CDZ64796.1 Hypothetical protein NGAL_HAMBI2566_62160 [Neorhizobium galegae bv. orientalis]